MVSLPRHLPTASGRGFDDLLNHAALVGEGVVRLKDGGLLAGFWFDGPDHESATAEELDHLSATVNMALRRLGTGWMLHVEAIRRRAADYIPGVFREVVDDLIDRERRANATHYRTDFACFLTYRPPLHESGSAWSTLKYVLTGARPSTEESLTEQQERFERTLRDLTTTLSSVLRIRRMTSHPQNDELLEALTYCLNGEWHQVRPPRDGLYLDCLLAKDMTVGDLLLYNRKLVAVVSVQRYPMESAPGMLAALGSLDCEYRWSNRFIFADFFSASLELAALRRKWKQKTTSMLSQVTGGKPGPKNLDAVKMTNDVDVALAELNANAVAFGKHTCCVLLRATDRRTLELDCDKVIKAFQSQGFEAKVETHNALEAFLGAIPGHGAENCRKPLVSTLNVSDMLPLAREWSGERRNPCSFYPAESPPLLQALTRQGSAFWLNLHVGDVGHTLILGPTGAGKSTLLATLASQFLRYPRSKVVVFDKGRSMLPLTLARRDGIHFDLGSETSPRLCPLATLATAADQGWAVEWVEGLLELQGVRPTPAQVGLIADAIGLLAHHGTGASERSLTALQTYLQDVELKQALAYYCTGPGALMLNGDTDSLTYSRFTTFELEELMALGPKVTAPALMYLFREVERRLDGSPMLLILDEAWLAISNPRFATKIKEWLKVLRKRNCAVVLATQSLADITNSPIRDDVFESCPTKILLPNPEAKSESLRRLYAENLNLNDVQITLLARAQKKREYYYLADGRARMFSLGLGPVALAFCGVSGTEDLRTVRALHATHGHQWVWKWLEQRGVSHAQGAPT